MKKLNRLFAILIAVLGVGSLSAQTDVTSQYVKNPNFTNKDNWTIKNAGTNNPTANNKCLEFWGSGNSSLYLLAHQEITNLPNGVYRLTINAFNRSQAGMQSNVYVYANTTDKEYTVSMKTRESEKNLYGSEPNSMSAASTAFYSTAGDYWLNTVDNIIVKDGKLDIGIRNVSQLTVNSGCWTIMGNVKLYQLTGSALSPLMNSLISEAQTLANKNYQGKSELNDAISTAQAVAEANLNYDAVIALQSAITTYKEGSLNSIDATTSTPVDATFLIKNAGFEDGATLKESTANGGYNEPKGWTLTYGSTHTNNHIVVANTLTNHAGYGKAVTPTEGSYTLGARMRWTNGSNEKITQTITLPSGSYDIAVDLGFNNTGSCVFTGTIGGTTVFKATPSKTDLTTFKSDKFSVQDGDELVLTFELKQSGASNTYAAMDNIRLTYYGDPIAAFLVDIASKKQELKAFHGTIPTNVYKSYSNHLTAAENANSTYTEAQLLEIVNNLNADIEAAKLLVQPYANLKSLIATCTSINTNSVEAEAGEKDVFATAIATATTNAETATTADDINEQYNTLEAARKVYVEKADPINDTYFDYTYKITNAAVASSSGWQNYREGSGQQYTDAPDNKYLDSWNGSGQDIYQELKNLPSGLYTLTAAGRASTGCTSAYIYLNDAKAEIDKAGNSGNELGNGWKWFTTEKTSVAGTAKIGFKANTANSQWAGADDFKLYYYGFDVTSAQNSVTSLKSQAEELATKPMNTDVLTELKTAISAADANKTTRLELNPMIENLDAAITAAKASIDEYVLIKKYIDKAKKFDNDADELKEWEEEYNAGSLTNAEPVRQALNVWTYNYVSENFKNEIALTEWSAESNAMWANFGEHWDGTTGEGCTSYYDANGTNTTHTLSKTVELTPGTYVFRGAGRSHPNTTLSLSIDIEGFEPVTFKAKYNTGYGIDKSGTANFSEGGTYANDDNKGCGWEWEFIKFTLNENTTVTLTATCQSSGWGWASFANNGLWMDDATYVIANAGALSTPLTSAKELVEKPMGNKEKEALTCAINQAEGEITTPKQLNDAIDALNKAINDANPSIETYAAIKTYIDKANTIDEYIATKATTYQSQYENGTIAESAEKVFQALEVATYNYVTEEFSYPVALSGDWTTSGPVGELSDQHWSGEKRPYMEQSSAAWGWDAWSISYDQDLTLPAGEYVFKVAGRKASGDGCTLELIVTKEGTTLGTVNDFPESDTGYGIDINGAANFSDEGTYANEDKGRGWQWRYVKFTLDSEATVNIAVKAEATTTHQWISFCDATVQMTEETYLEANKGGLDAPTAAAEALVDTKPMGTVENETLQAALDMPVTTGAELKAKITALETAVANANAWVVAYNKAKAPLIAAFERFETDFNDGANGTLRPMSNEAWTTLLEAVKVAALAKDVTDSYDDFEQAAEDFNTAMNAAEKAILQYSGTSFIKNAECISNEAWIGTGRSVQSGEHWSGDETREYFAQNFDPGVARTQEVKLPCSGWYVLKVSIRAVNANSYADIVINGKNNKVMGAHGKTGGTIATDGTEWESVAAGIAAGKTFANDNKGYGWVYKYIPFYVENDGDVVTIAIGLSNKDQNRLANCGGMELYYKGDNCIVKDGTIVKHYGKFADQQVVTNTTHDVTNAELDNKTIDVTANPNALIIANEGQVSNANNVIVNGNAASLVLTEGYAFNATADFTATELNYAREFSDNWLTVCLPFAYEIPENVKVETLTAVDLDTKTFTFNEVNGTMEANKPYIIKNSSETAALFAELGDVAVKATPEAMTIKVTADNSEYEAEFIGTYTAVKTDALMEITEDVAKYDILFFGSDGQLYYLSQGVTTKVVNIKPFRAYIRLPKGAIDWTDGQQAIARHGKGTSSIDDVQYTDDNATIIYDLMGRKVTTMVKGNMYIINGRKVIVK